MVAYDAVGPSAAGIASATTPLTWTHINGGNALLVGANTYNAGSNTVTGVTYGGVTIPLLGWCPSGGGSGGIGLYGLVGGALPSGSNTVSVAFTGGSDTIGGSVSYSGAGGFSATAVASPAVTSGNSATSAAMTTHAGGILAAVASYGGLWITPWSCTGGNVRWGNAQSGSSGADNALQGDIASTGASQTITLACTNGSTDQMALVAVEVLPATLIPDLVMATRIAP